MLLILSSCHLLTSLLILAFIQVAAVMKKAARTLKVAAKLKKLTKLAVVKENATRWSSTYDMVNRYFRIQLQLSALVELLELLPTPVERSRHSVERLQGSRDLSSHHNIAST